MLVPSFFYLLSSRTNSYKLVASDFLVVASKLITRTVTSLLPNSIVISSPILSSLEGLARIPLTRILLFSATSLAKVLRLISLDTFKYLSNRMIHPKKKVFLVAFLPHAQQELCVRLLP